MMQLGLIYLVFLPSILTTPFAGYLSQHMGQSRALWLTLALAALGLPLLLSTWLVAVLAGMALVAVGTFGAQAIATGYAGQSAGAHRSAASGLYLASYYLGGLAGTAILGQIFDRYGWTTCVAGIAVSIAAAAILALYWKRDRS
jgi:predicted MFS family arabinose efflux permease